MSLKKTSQLIGVFLLTLSLQGCRWFYGPDIHQGNNITDLQLSQLKQGMTIQQVKKILGTPILVQNKGNLLDTEKKEASLQDKESDFIESGDEADLMKLEYVYLYQPKYGKTIRKRVSLTFEDEKLIEFKVIT